MYQLNLTGVPEKKIYPLGEKFTGRSPEGNELSFTNY